MIILHGTAIFIFLGICLACGVLAYGGELIGRIRGTDADRTPYGPVPGSTPPQLDDPTASDERVGS